MQAYELRVNTDATLLRLQRTIVADQYWLILLIFGPKELQGLYRLIS